MADLGDLQAKLGGAAEAAELLEDVLEGLPDVLHGSFAAAVTLGGVIDRLNASFVADAAAARLADAANVSLAQAKAAIAASARAAADAEAAGMAAQAAAAREAARAAKDLAREQKEAADKAKAAYEESAQPMRNFTASLDQSVMHAADLPGPIGAAQGALSQLGAAGGVAALGLGVATIAVTTLVDALEGGMAKAIEVVERVNLLRDALAGLAGGAAQGAAAGSVIDGLVQQLPFAKEKTEAWAATLLGAGEAGATLAAHVRAIAAAQALTAVTGGQGGVAAERMFKTLAMGGKAADTLMKQVHQGGRLANNLLSEMGLNIKDLGGEAAVAKMNAAQFGDALTQALQRRGAGALEDMANSWPNILTKAREGLASLFDGLGPAVEPFMSATKGLFGEFSKGGVAVNTLKPIVTAVFGTLFAWGTKAVNAIHRGFLMLTIAGLQAYIAMRPLITGLKEFVSSASFITGLKVAFIALAAVVFLAALPFLLLAAVGLVVVAAFALLVAGAIWVAGTIAENVSNWIDLLEELGPGAASAAGDFVLGLVNGILDGRDAVIAAVSNLASGALASFKGIFGIASPSKVMLEHGEDNIAGATATGIDRGSDKVDAAMARMGSGEPGAGKGGKGEKSGGKGGRTVQFNNCNFGSGITEEQIRGWVLKVLEQEASGGPEPVTT